VVSIFVGEEQLTNEYLERNSNRARQVCGASGGFGFLARSLWQRWLNRGIKKFEADLKATADSELEHLKAELKAKGDISIEELKSRLQQTASSAVLEAPRKRAEVMAELYRRAVEVLDVGEKYVFQMGAREHEEQYAVTNKTMVEFYDFFDEHRIYLPERVCRLAGRFHVSP
jgi:hypothetical protein